MIALQLATGRRKNELGYLSTLAKTRRKSHLKIDIIAKKRPDAMKALSKAKNASNVYILAEHKHPIPVVFYTPEQILELHTLLRKKLVKDLYENDPKPLKAIKRLQDSVSFDRDAGNSIREAFHTHFPIEAPDSQAIRQFGVHNVCRSIYAQYAYVSLKDTTPYLNKTLLSFTNLALGHNEEDLTTTSDYLAVLLIDDTQKSRRKVSHNLAAEPLPKRPKTIAPKDFDDTKIKDRDLLMEIIELSGKHRNPGLLAAHLYLRDAQKPKISEIKKKIKSAEGLKLYFDVLSKYKVKFDFMEEKNSA
jgi:hypothetical protein